MTRLSMYIILMGFLALKKHNLDFQKTFLLLKLAEFFSFSTLKPVLQTS